MAEDIMNTPTPDISSLLGELLANKELMGKIGEIAGKTEPQDREVQSSPQSLNIDSLLSNPDIMSKLPEVIGVIKPLISNGGGEGTGGKFQDGDKRLALLMALKPYLSSKRCEAIDYIVKMSKLSQTVKSLKL